MSDDPQLDGWLLSARTSIDQSLKEAQGDGVADFAAVMEELHRRSPELVSDTQVRQAASLTPVVALVCNGEDEQDPALDAVLTGARANIETEVAQRRQRGIPTPVAAPQLNATGDGARTRWLFGGLAAAAAIGLLFVGGRSLLTASGAERNETHEQALFTAEHGGVEQAVSPDAAETRSQPTSDRSPDEKLPGSDDLQSPTDSESEPPVIEPPGSAHRGAKPGHKHSGRRDSSGAASRRGLEDQLRDLDAQAQKLLRAGDARGAEQRFEEIVRRGKRTRYADLAYGDLFTLASQRGETKREAKLWRAYLARFPKGRYADDATAGLCRREKDDTRKSCWAGYLGQFPNGVHKSRALTFAEEEEEP